MKTIQHTLAWEIRELPIYANNSKLVNHKAIFRNDTNGLLSVAKQSYTPTPNTRFIEVVEKMHTVTGFPIKCYDEFEGGKKVLAFLECTEPIKVCGYEFKDYMLIGNSHDRSTGFFIGNSSQMVRCSNRFSKIFRQLPIHHTRNHDKKIDDLVHQFEVYMRERKEFFLTMAKMHHVQIDESIKRSLIERLARMNEEERIGIAELSKRKANIVSSLTYCIDTECFDLGNTAFGLLQGVTNYTTHVRKNRPQEKVFGNVFGGAARMNEDAFRFCQALL